MRWYSGYPKACLLILLRNRLRLRLGSFRFRLGSFQFRRRPVRFLYYLVTYFVQQRHNGIERATGNSPPERRDELMAAYNETGECEWAEGRAGFGGRIDRALVFFQAARIFAMMGDEQVPPRSSSKKDRRVNMKRAAG